MTAILGISAFYHDSAAALIVDGEIVAALQEERFSRHKNDDAFPQRAIAACLGRAGLDVCDLDYVGYYDKPYLTFERLLETYVSYAPRGYRAFAEAMPIWLKQKLRLPREMRRDLGGYEGPIVFAEHHESHAAGAFYPSPFERAAILTMDGVGEWATASWGVGRGHEIELSHELHFPHSLGLLYTAFTSYAGFKVNSDEYKLMGLAPYGEPRYVDRIYETLLDLREDGSFRLDMDYFDYAAGLRMTNERFAALFEGPPRAPETPIDQRHMDVAASIQRVCEEIVLRTARHVHARTGEPNLCLSGGVALNCVANGRLQREGPFERVWIQPAAGDAGSALGVALFIWHQLLGSPRPPLPQDGSSGSLLGDAFSDEAIGAFLRTTGARYELLDGDETLCESVAADLAQAKVVGWFQGRMEFGPRALGSRSILGDPRERDMQRKINQKVKFREGFRPFAPAVLREHAGEYFECDAEQDSPYMLVVCPVRSDKREPLSPAEQALSGLDRVAARRSVIPAVTHVDDSARIQTVDAERHGIFHRLLSAFHARTGCPVLVNTSFNLGWEPIVHTPREAYESFMSSDIDVLCMGHYVLRKEAQPASLPASVRDEPARRNETLGGILVSPCCGGDLGQEEACYRCAVCDHEFPLSDGIPQLFWPHGTIADDRDVTEQVKAFYEETPFPNYQGHETLRSLIDRSQEGAYAHALDRAIPYNTRVLEVGCGTGQLSNFLGIGCRRVIGADLCLNSLRLGEAFRARHNLGRVTFLQMNLFSPVFEPGSFDVVLCNGVLHHTSDPRAGFEGLVPLVKRGGYVVIGLYNRWGRLATDMRRSIFEVTGGRARFIDPYLRTGGLSPDKERAWFADQYRHPHESKHSMGEVLEWFADAGLEFVRGVPSLRADGDDLPERVDGEGGLFTPEAPSSRLDRFVVQAAQIWKGRYEGGFYLMVGRKP